MRARWMSVGIGAATLALAQSCSDVCACSPALAIAIVTGQVTRAGAPVPGALINSFSAPGPACQSLDVPLDGGLAGPDGTFLVELATSPRPEDLCVYVFARADGAEGESRDSDTGFVVLDFSAGIPDTGRVTLTLPTP